jgi:lipid A 3-O-deacylase
MPGRKAHGVVASEQLLGRSGSSTTQVATKLSSLQQYPASRAAHHHGHIASARRTARDRTAAIGKRYGEDNHVLGMQRKNLQLVMGGLACSLIAHASGNAYALNLAPTSAFVQAGFGDQKTDAYLAGATWNVPWHQDFGIGWFGVFVEAAFGRWHTDGRHDSTAWPTQISTTPVLRFHPSLAPSWFAEIGVGANYIVPLFKSGHKRFSTEFNFGDHVALGREFGRSEVSVRIEHFSNAGISHPNPGENFMQVRYAYRF